jgi:hypothetical protein
MVTMKSFEIYAASEHRADNKDRLPSGAALLAILGLSFVGWVVVLLPLATILNK